MADLTPAATSAFCDAQREAGNSTDALAYAVVAALRGVALEVAALRQTTQTVHVKNTTKETRRA